MINRREFLRNCLYAGAPVLAGDYIFLKDYKDYRFIEPVKNPLHARVVSVKDRKAVSWDFSINDERAANLCRKALLVFTGKNSIKEAVRSLFPEFHESLRVSLKINTASWDMPSHHAVADTIAACLVEAGLKPGNILIWERSEGTLQGAGYAIEKGKGRIKVVATDTEGYGYDEDSACLVHGVPVYLTSIITRHSDYLINIGVLKHHFIAGVTTAMKNLYGAVPLLDRPFLTGPANVLKMHISACDPYISEINALVAGKVRTVLYVCDALLGSYNNGPWGPPQWIQNEIIMANDPVAMDTMSLYRIEKKRKEVGLPPILSRAVHVRTSALMGLGTNNTENMEIIERIAE